MANTKIKGAHVHHIALRASDYEKSKKFYSEGLGFSIYAEWGDPSKQICMLDMGDGGKIELFNNGGASLPEDFEGRKGSFFHLAIGVEDVDQAYERAIAHGAVSKIEPKDVTIAATPPMPVRLAFVIGPDGEILEFFHEK